MLTIRCVVAKVRIIIPFCMSISNHYVERYAVPCSGRLSNTNSINVKEAEQVLEFHMAFKIAGLCSIKMTSGSVPVCLGND